MGPILKPYFSMKNLKVNLVKTIELFNTQFIDFQNENETAQITILNLRCWNIIDRVHFIQFYKKHAKLKRTKYKVNSLYSRISVKLSDLLKCHEIQ